MDNRINRAIPLGTASGAADAREAATSPRMGRTMRLDILPDEADFKRASTVSSSSAGAGRAALTAEELLNLFQNAYDATVVTDSAGIILFDNIRAREFLFAEAGTLIGVNILSLISGADADTIATIQETLEDERFIRISAWCHSITGDYFPADIAVYRTAAGSSPHLCFFIRDVTDRVRAEEAERTVERNKVMMESIGTVCHHLGQPSTVIINSLEMLKDMPADDPSRDELLSLSVEAAERIGDLLRELNDLRTYRSESYTDNDSIVSIENFSDSETEK